MTNAEIFKRQAAARALELIRPGMKLGLGTGSTARQFVELLGEAVQKGLQIIGVPSSQTTAAQASALGIPLATLDDLPELDMTIDGADEVDTERNLIKGGGGALLREKIVAAASRAMVVIADEAKYVARLGAFPLPLEVIPFGLAATLIHVERALEGLRLTGALALRKRDDQVFVTDGGHWIVDCHLGHIPDATSLAMALEKIPGVVDHGLFLGMADLVILAGPNGVRNLGGPTGSQQR